MQIKKTFSELKDCGGLIYFANALCVSKEGPGKGLGAELLKSAYKVALDSLASCHDLIKVAQNRLRVG